ncbi:MAG: hypothetical protein JW820_19770 [Spirochaetales bacterium]|nr:hypothetical protein [Spirochaetales bacterium]
MSGIRDGDCLCNRPAGVSFLQVLGQRVGVAGAEELFRRWEQAGREPAELTAEEVLAGLRERNYVSAAVEGGYVEAARCEYARWRTRAGRPAGTGGDAQG